MKIKLTHIVLGLLAMAALSACGGYNKIYRSTDNELKYNAAVQYFNNGKYGKSTPLFEQLMIAYINTQRDDTVHFFLAKGYWGQKDYFSGAYYLDQFCKNYGRSKFVEEAYYLRALCYYEDTYRYELDQANTIRAIGAFNELLMRHPNAIDKDVAETHLKELHERLELKSFYSARIYYDIDDYKSAVVALRNSAKDYPESKFKEETMFLILKSSYLYARNSIQARQKERYIASIDEYYNFASEFPESKYTKEAMAMYNTAVKYVERNKSEEDLILEKIEQPDEK